MSGEPRRLRRNDLKIASTWFLPNRTRIELNGIPRSASSSSISRNVLPHHPIRERVSKTSVSADKFAAVWRKLSTIIWLLVHQSRPDCAAAAARGQIYLGV